MRLGESLLEYVRRGRAYHYLIDRFGRVYRVVAESDAANHAEPEQLRQEVAVSGVQSGFWEGHARLAPFVEVRLSP